jgi:CheY-like chemotaxis protein/HPt (histidine-containing phosphotransfer) domain-containing protein
MNLLKKINKSLELNFYISQYNVLLAALLSFFGHPLYWALWTFIFPNHYDSFILRFSCCIMGLLLIFVNKWPKFLKRFAHIYWYIFITLILPITFTYLGLKNNFTEVWVACYIMAFFFVILFSYHILISISQIIFGTAVGFLYFFPESRNYTISQANIELFIVYIFTFFAGIMFSYFGKLGVSGYLDEKQNHQTQRQRNKLLESLSASIAHELKNPLLAIKMKIIATYNNMQQFRISDRQNEIFRECFMFIESSIKRANDIIAISLNELRGKRFTPDELIYMEICHTIKKAIEEYGYSNSSDKKKIKFDFKDNFIFKADKAAFIYVIFNLIKNSLYYSNNKKNFQITISTKEEKNHNIVIVKDNGPGIKTEELEKIFESFYTSGKKGGTGLGLPFCKRAVESFFGNIKCESEFGKWTKFIISLPKIDDETAKKAKNSIGLRHKSSSSSAFLKTTRAKILLVDDYKSNVVPLKSKIEAYLPNFSCDIEIDSTKVLDLIKKKKYNLILMDLDMPKMNGFQCVKAIRKINNNIPILAHTSHKTKEIAKKAMDVGMNGFMTKPCDNMLMLRNVSKWCFNEFSPIGLISINDTKTLLSDKLIVVIDDQESNLKITSEFLRQYIKKVTSFYNSQEALRFIKKNYHDIDIVITDINMPNISGDELAAEIRKIESKYSKLHLPIIAITGEDDDKAIHGFLQKGLDDFIVKGSDLDYMTQILALWSNVLPHGTKYDLRSNKKILSIFSANNKKIQQKKEESNNIFFNKNKLEFLAKEDLLEIIKGFKEESIKIMDSIKKSIDKNDIKKLFSNTHALKGISGSIGLEVFSAYISDINNVFRNGKMPEDKDWFRELENLMQKSLEAIGE